MSTRILVHLIFCFFKILSAPKVLLLRSRITLRYYLDFVTVILTAPSLQTYVVPRAVTEQTVTQSRRQVKFSVSKWLKLTQSHLFTPFFDWKKQFCKGKTYKTYEKRAIGLYISIYVRFEIGSVYTIQTIYTASLPWKFLNFDGVLQRFPSLTQANSQVCFKWMSKCVI